MEVTMTQRLKTRGDVYDQWQRISRGFCRRGKRLAAKLAPETGGNSLYCHNWSITYPERADYRAANEAWLRNNARDSAARKIYERVYNQAEHRTHGDGFRPLWCDSCGAA
jgi:hypothetical protein